MNEGLVLVTGATGQLGFDIVKELNENKIANIGVSSSDLDIINKESVKEFFNKKKICYVIHCAAYTKVDLAEEEKELNYKINFQGTANLVFECKKYDIPMIYFSTDYVFGGEGNIPYKENDNINPMCEYAKAKYLGENEVKKLNKFFIIRISWVFGKNGNNFIKTMLKLSETKKEISVVSDQIGSPTYTVDVAKSIILFLNSNKYGIYHLTNEGYVSWSNFAREIFKKAKKNVIVKDITTEEFISKAKRPKNSRLDKSKLLENGFKRLPSWQDALDRYFFEIGVEV